MKLSIERAALLRSLSHVQSIVERRTTMPILSNVKLAATGADQLELTATDLDLTLIAHEQAVVADPGATTVAANTLFDIVRKLPDGATLVLEQPPGRTELTVSAGRTSFSLPTLAADEFPAAAIEQLEVQFPMPAKDLAKLIDRTRFAISTEETRYYLNGIHFHATKDGAASVLRAVATDGHRLARVEVALPAGAESFPPIIMPRKMVAEARKLLEGADGDVAVSVTPGRIHLAIGGTVLASRLIDGTYPDYERVIPQGNERMATLPAKPFTVAVDRVATITSDKTRAVKLSFTNGSAVVSAVSAELGRGSDEFDADYQGEPMDIGFNARYVLDMMGSISGPEVRLEMGGTASPTVARDPSDSSLLFVLMPMRV